MTDKKYDIILADDHDLMLDGLSGIIKSNGNYNILALANSGEELINYVRALKPDICIVDLDMPGMTGIQASEKLIDEFPDIKILILTMHKEKSLVKRMQKTGIKGYVVKTCDRDELLFAIKQILKGKTYFSGELLNETDVAERSQSDLEKASSLTKREIEILELICDGLTNKQVAEKLFLSHKTIDNHRTNIMKKLDVHNTAELIKFCINNNIAS